MKVTIGTKVHCALGTKDGVGVVVSVYNDGCIVEFPHVDYPLTLSTISGLYFVDERDIIRIVEDENDT